MSAAHPRLVPAGADSPKVTLVIGWGGVRCAAALGVVKAMADAGIGIERVVGCSAGAIFAALAAFGYSIEESTAITMRLWPRELARQRGPRALLARLAPRLFGSKPAEFGMGNPHALLRGLAAEFGGKLIEAAPLALHLTATDFANGELVELDTGSLAEGLAASLSVPPACAPQQIGDRLLVDGYLSDPLPVSVAIKHGASVIVAVGFESAYPARAERAGRSQLNAILANNLLRAKLAFHSAAHHAEMIIIFPEFRARAGSKGKDKLAYIIDAGEQAALQQLPYLHHLLAQAQVPAAA
jgi:NTE family protein